MKFKEKRKIKKTNNKLEQNDENKIIKKKKLFETL
jgi:hypothetical protein